MEGPRFYRNLRDRVLDQLTEEGLTDALLLLSQLGRACLTHHLKVKDWRTAAWASDAAKKDLSELAADVRGAPASEQALHSATVLLDKIDIMARLENFGPIDEWVEGEEWGWNKDRTTRFRR
jgi:hypothetical protein